MLQRNESQGGGRHSPVPGDGKTAQEHRTENLGQRRTAAQTPTSSSRCGSERNFDAKHPLRLPASLKPDDAKPSNRSTHTLALLHTLSFHRRLTSCADRAAGPCSGRAPEKTYEMQAGVCQLNQKHGRAAGRRATH